MKFLSNYLVAFFCLTATISFAANHVVTIPGGNNPWAPTAGSFAAAVVAAQNSGDTIIFDYTTLGASPTITLENGFTSFGLGGFVVDGLRDLPGGSALPKFAINGAVGQWASALLIQNNNTTLIGLDFDGIAGNAIMITSNGNTIDTCEIHGSNYHAVNISGTSSGNTIKNSTIYNNNLTALGVNDDEHGAVYAAGPGTIIDSCYIYDNGANGVLIRNSTAASAEIKNSVFGRDRTGTELGNDWNGIFVWGANGAHIHDNIIVNNGMNPNGSPVRLSGIRIQEVSSGTIIDTNYVGTDPLKTSAGNAFDGITLHTSVSNVSVSRNIVCHNGFLAGAMGNGGGIAVRNTVSNCTFTRNFVGLHHDLSDGGNNDYGISLEAGNNNTIGGPLPTDGNIIGNSKRVFSLGAARGAGIWITRNGCWPSCIDSYDNEVYNNIITSNSGAGIEISTGAYNNIVGANNQGNNINGNLYGILVHGTNASNNTLRYNSFSCNTTEGISLQNSGNDEYGNNAPLKDVLVNTSEKRANFVSGYAPSANATVDIYVADNLCPVGCDDAASQGMTMVATVTASSTPGFGGLYFWEYDFVAGGNLVNKNNVVVLATESGIAGAVNTSEFSVCADLCNTPENSAINSNNLDLCPGETAAMIANSTGKAAGEGYSYTWYLGSIDPLNIVHYAVDDSSYSTSTSGTYLVLISSQLDSASCNDTTTTAVVVMNTQPTINLTGSNLVCTGDSIILDAGTSGANLSHTWKPNGETADTLVVKSGDTYEVVVENTLTGCKDSANITVSESAPPSPSPSAPFFCQGDSTLVDAGVAGMSYLWTPSGNTSQSFYVSTEGMHYVTVTDPSSNCIALDSVFADQSPDPKPTVTLPADTFLCEPQGQTIEIIAQFTTSTPGDLSWNGGTEISDSSIVASQVMTYIATYADSFACTGADTIEVINLCSPPDPIVPNIVTQNSPWTPFGDITPDQILKSNFVVYDRWGLKMYSSEEVLPNWNGYKENGAKCSSGVYFWIWEFTDNTETEKKWNGFLQLVNE